MKPEINQSAGKHQRPSARYVEIKIDPTRRGKGQKSAPNVAGIIEKMARLDWAACPVWNFTSGGKLTLAGWMN